MNEQEPSKINESPENKKSSQGRDKAVAIAIITGVVTVITTLISAVIGPLLTRDTPPSSTIPEPSSLPPSTSSESTSDLTAKLPPPVMKEPKCNSARKWPPDNYFFPIYWHPVEGAASYGIEIDCRSSKDDPTAWRGSEDHPWFIKRGVAFRLMNNPIYSSKIHLRAKDVGCDSLRWRVWAIDHNGNDGEKCEWCQISFF